MVQRSYRTWLVSLALLGAILDQTSKYGIFAWLNQGSSRVDTVNSSARSFEIIPGWFKLYVQYTDKPAGESMLRSVSSDRLPHVNHGALFGLLNEQEGGANGLFAGISILAGVAIVGWSFRRAAAGDRLLCAALGLILAGTLGNLYDRLVFGGVRDFFYWYGGFDWPVFNVADCCLVCGAVALLAHAFLTHPAPDSTPARSHAQSASSLEGEVVTLNGEAAALKPATVIVPAK